MRVSELILICSPNQPLNFEFKRGKVNLLVGKNGAGKTTLLRALLREPVVKSGKVEFPPTESLSYLPQEPIFPDHLKVRDLLRLAFLGRTDLFGRLPKSAEENIDRELDWFGLTPLKDRPLGELSSGERQKAFLARTLLQPAQVILLDEPTNHLDADITDRFWERIAELPGRGVEVIASTHDREIIRGRRFHNIEISVS